MNVSAVFIRRPIGTSLLAAAVLLLGIAAWPFLPVAALPEVDLPTVQVSAALPGASPATMSATVATPLERQFALISGLSEMTSTSYLGTTTILLQFGLDRDPDAAAADVLAAINAAGGQLPNNLPSPPTYRKTNPADRPVMVLAATSATLPMTTVSDYADNVLGQSISQISGVGEVQLYGTQKPAVRVQIDPARISALNLGLEDIRAQMAAATVNAPKGTFDGSQQSVMVYDNDQIGTAREWNDVTVAYRNGAPVRIRDVGQAIDGAENSKLSAWMFPAGDAAGPGVIGQPVILMTVRKQPGANVIETVDKINAALPTLQQALPPAMHTYVIADRTQTIRASVHEVELTLLLTGALVILVIFVFLRNVAATLIPGATVPLALLGTAAAMFVLNYSLDNLSLMALTVATGFVVDDAIVVLENIYRHVEAGMSPMDAALLGAREVGFTIVSIAISLIAVFLPLLLMSGVVGRMFHEFAMVMSMAILVSVAIALTLTPMLCSLFLRPHASQPRHGRVFMWFERGFQSLYSGYDRGLRFVLAHQRSTLLVFIATALVTLGLYIVVPKGFFPQQDTGFIQGTAQAAQDVSTAAMSQRLQALADVIRREPEIRIFGYNFGGTTFNTANFFITLRTGEEGRQVDIDTIIARLRRETQAVPGITFSMQAQQDIIIGARNARTQYQYTLTDPDIVELGSWAPRMLERLQKLPQLVDVVSDQQTGAAALNLAIDRDRASSFGVSPALIDATLYDAIGQRQVAQYFTQQNTYHVVLEVTPEQQRDPALLDRLYVSSPTLGRSIPLSSFITADNTRTNYLSVGHQGQLPAVTISFNLLPGHALGEAVEQVQAAARDLAMPGTMHGSFQGAAQAFQETLATQPYLIGAALLAVYIVLGLLYESYIHPLTILSTLPSAGAGALLMLLVSRNDLSVIALIGIILLIGLVKKNGIMMVDFALTAERERGVDSEQSIYEACLLRFRPIMMTTTCAIFAGLPLMLGHGTGSEMRRPLGFAMVGGLVLSQMLTLFTTPVVYLYLDRLSHRLRRRRRAGTGPVHA